MFKYMSTTKTVFETYPDPKKSPLGPQKVQNSPEIKSNSNVRIEGSIENESCSTIIVDPRYLLNSNQHQKLVKKMQNDPKK